MPKSEAPRKKSLSEAQKKLKQVYDQAQQLDRRRQAQIENQRVSINRLLKDGTYSEEMKILHEAAAVLKVENDDLRTALKELVLDVLNMDMDVVAPGSASENLTDEMLALAGVERP